MFSHKHLSSNRGFTLIELMLVISIIGLLASIVVSALSSARLKARDSAIISEVQEMQKIAELVYSDTGSYVAVQPPVHLPDIAIDGGPFTCAGVGGGGNYTAQYVSICNNILANNVGTGAYNEWDFLAANGVSLQTRYSFSAWLPYAKKLYCVGSSGSSITADGSGVGCWGTP